MYLFNLSFLLTFLLMASNFLYGSQENFDKAKPTTFDTGGNLIELDATLNLKLELLSYPFFIKAKAAQKSDGNILLKIFYKDTGETVVTYKEISKAEFQLFQEKIDKVLQNDGTSQTNLENTDTLNQNRNGNVHEPNTLNRDGIYLLLATTTIGGLIYGGLFSDFLEIKNRNHGTSLSMIMGAAGFLLPLLFTLEKEVPMNLASSATHGFYRGLVDGFFVATLIDPQKDSNKVFDISTLLFSSVEFGLGIYLSKKYNYTAGESSAFSSGSLYGYFLGSTLISAIEEQAATNIKPQIFSAATLLGGLGGLWLGIKMTQGAYFAEGDASVNEGLSLYTTIWSLSLVNFFGDTRQSGATIAFLSIGATMTIGYFLAKEYDFSANDALVINLAGTAGLLLGLGIAFSTDAHPDGYFIAITSGALFCYLLTLALIKKDGDHKSMKTANGEKISIHFNIASLLDMIQPQKPSDLGESDKEYTKKILSQGPTISLQYKF